MAVDGHGDQGGVYRTVNFPEISFPGFFLDLIPDEWIGSRQHGLISYPGGWGNLAGARAASSPPRNPSPEGEGLF